MPAASAVLEMPAETAAPAVMTDPSLLLVPGVAGTHHLQHGLVLLCSALAAVLLCALALQCKEKYQPSGIWTGWRQEVVNAYKAIRACPPGCIVPFVLQHLG